MPHDAHSAFSSGLLTGGDVPPGVVDPDGNPAPKRYGVYQNNVVVSLIDALKARFPAVVGLIGDAVFAQMARAFITHSQPQSPLLAEYGKQMPEFLAMSAPLQHMPYLADVARLELVWLDAYHGADADPLPPDAIAALEEEALVAARFKVHPCTHLVSSKFAVCDLWHSGRQGVALETVDTAITQGALITRPDTAVMVAALSPQQVVFFERLIDGATLGAAVEAAMQAGEFDVPNTLQLMISSGALTSIVA